MEGERGRRAALTETGIAERHCLGVELGVEPIPSWWASFRPHVYTTPLEGTHKNGQDRHTATLPSPLTCV